MLRLTETRRINRIPRDYARMSLSALLSESYRLLYDCKNPKVKKLIERHIEEIKTTPNVVDKISILSENVHILRSLVSLGSKARLSEGELAQVSPDEEIRDESDTEDTDELDDRDVIEGQPDKTYPRKNLDPMQQKAGADVLGESKKKKSTNFKGLEEVDASQRVDIKTRKTIKDLPHVQKLEDCDAPKKKLESWDIHKSKMIPALKNFRESSKSKAFYKTLSRMTESLRSKKRLSMTESISLYKAVNSAMTHLAVELEHNPGFIYTFNECTSRLSQDTNALLTFIRANRAPSGKLMESILGFTEILLAEGAKRLREEDDEELNFEIPGDEVLPDEEAPEEDTEKIPDDSKIVTPDGDEIPLEDVTLKDLDVDLQDIQEYIDDEIADSGEEVVDQDLNDVSEEEAAELEKFLLVLRANESGETEEEGDEDIDPDLEITDEELESLKTELTEMRKRKSGKCKVKESKTRRPVR